MYLIARMKIAILFIVGLGLSCGSDEADGKALCEDVCKKTNECEGGSTNCSDHCSSNDDGGDDDGGECKNQDAILKHIRGCLDKSCDQFSSCLSSQPSCTGNGDDNGDDNGDADDFGDFSDTDDFSDFSDTDDFGDFSDTDDFSDFSDS